MRFSDGECADSLYCNGAESCDAYGDCQVGSDPCGGESCDEQFDQCVAYADVRLRWPSRKTHTGYGDMDIADQLSVERCIERT